MATIPTRKDDKLILEITNGDLTKMEEAIERWNFKDEQSFLRFVVSVLLLTEDKALWMKKDGESIPIAPAEHSIKK